MCFGELMVKRSMDEEKKLCFKTAVIVKWKQLERAAINYLPLYKQNVIDH